MTVSLEQWRRRGRTYRHRGHSIFTLDDRRSEGPVLLCLHGFPTASWDFAEVWESFFPRFGRVVAVDLIGFGFSDKPRDYTYDLVDQADLNVEFTRSLDIREAHVLAHDYGVSIAQELLARHAEGDGLRLKSVTFLNGGLFPEAHRARTIQKLLLGPLGPLVARLTSERRFAASLSAVFGPATQPTPEQLRAFWALLREQRGDQILHKLMRYIPDRRRHRERWVGALQETSVPLRVINGPKDPVSGAHLVARYRELVPNADVVTLPGIGHYPQVEAPEAVVKAFLAFVERTGA